MQSAAPENIVNREERVEYRDQDGNLLDEEEVASLMAEGKASFSTKYQTETLLVDEFGNILPENSLAPEHPDVEGQDPDTKGPTDASRNPASVEVPVGVAENKEVKSPVAEPASEASEATK